MKIIVICSLIAVACLPAHGADSTFANLLARVTQRSPITKAILAVDKQPQRNFRLEVEGDRAKVTIWQHMKIRDLNEETYTFPLSAVIRQEHARLVFQGELNDLIARCKDSERRFRISQYKEQPIRYGMRYEEARELLRGEFRPYGQPRTEAGAYRLESDTHSIVFRHGVLVDLITKETSNKELKTTR